MLFYATGKITQCLFTVDSLLFVQLRCYCFKCQMVFHAKRIMQISIMYSACCSCVVSRFNYFIFIVYSVISSMLYDSVCCNVLFDAFYITYHGAQNIF